MDTTQAAWELLDEWLRSLTILLGEDDKTLEERLAMIEQVNQPGTLQVQITSPIGQQDADNLHRAVAEINDLAQRQVKMHVLVDELLIRMLAHATDQAPLQVIQQLALNLERQLPRT